MTVGVVKEDDAPKAETPDDGGPAYPVPEVKNPDGAEWFPIRFPGMSVRKWYAGQALPGSLHIASGGNYIKDAAREAYRVADAMIAEGKKPADDSVADELLDALKLIRDGYKDSRALEGSTCLEVCEAAIAAAEKRMGR